MALDFKRFSVVMLAFAGVLLGSAVVTIVQVAPAMFAATGRVEQRVALLPVEPVHGAEGGSARSMARLLNDPALGRAVAEWGDVSVPDAVQKMEPWRRRYFCRADFNKDDAISADDLVLFMRTFQSREGLAAEWLDVNLDGVVDERDFVDFINAFMRAHCDPAERAKIRPLVC